MHDTLKKPRELLAVAYAILFPDLAAKSKHLGGDVNLDTMDPAVGSAFFHLSDTFIDTLYLLDC